MLNILLNMHVFGVDIISLMQVKSIAGYLFVLFISLSLAGFLTMTNIK